MLYVVNLHFQSGAFPAKLKNAAVILVFKSGKRVIYSIYRPISLFSCFSKIYEKTMKQKIIKYLDSVNFLVGLSVTSYLVSE